MKLLMIGLAALVCLAARPGFAKSWSGFLVDSNCYESEERNVNPWDTETYVDRDRDWEIRYCSPNTKTKSFTIVDHNGMSFRLDTAGNAKAGELIRKAGKKNFLEVTVNGEMSKDELKVYSISVAP
jgi:hypothetical protein